MERQAAGAAIRFEGNRIGITRFPDLGRCERVTQVFHAALFDIDPYAQRRHDVSSGILERLVGDHGVAVAAHGGRDQCFAFEQDFREVVIPDGERGLPHQFIQTLAIGNEAQIEEVVALADEKPGAFLGACVEFFQTLDVVVQDFAVQAQDGQGVSRAGREFEIAVEKEFEPRQVAVRRICLGVVDQVHQAADARRLAFQNLVGVLDRKGRNLPMRGEGQDAGHNSDQRGRKDRHLYRN